MARTAAGTPQQRRAAHHLRILLAAATASVLLITLTPTTASAAPAWSVQTTPSVAGPPEGTLGDVHCITATNCYAVGSYVTASQITKTLVQKWNGTGWTLVSSPNPAASTESVLRQVSCFGATFCMAVGVYDAGTTGAPLIERFNGTSWAIVTSPVPVGATFSQLTGVSCSSATFCLAVGSYVDASFVTRTMVQKWNGTAWTVVTTTDPAGSIRARFEGVSCLTGVYCFVTGDWEDSIDTYTLTKRWNGTGLVSVASPSPAGAVAISLAGVTCLSTSSCITAGWYDAGAGSKSLSQRWNGTTWATVTTPQPSGSSQWRLTGVSCVTATTTCFGVGSYDTIAGRTFTVAAKWNGSAWSLQTSQNRTGARSSTLLGISCTSTSMCLASGNSAGTLVEKWNGTSWAIVASLANSSQTALSGLACTSSTNCFAVGSAVTPVGPVTHIERWNGTAWSTMTSPTPTNALEIHLTGVACTSSTACIAVGSWLSGLHEQPLALKWNGTAWSTLTVATPGGSFTSKLTAVACPAVNTCYAVGTSTSFAGQTNLVEKWNGTAWTIVSTVTPSSASGVELRSITCPSTLVCWGAGVLTTATGYLRNLFVRWNGTAWTSPSAPTPLGAVDASLMSIACPITSTCVAVGSSTTATGVEKSQTLTFAASAWSVVTSPNPAGAAETVLNGVSCTSTASCTAVGQGYAGGQTKTLAEQWNGTAWSIVTTANPVGAKDSVLNAVACQSSVSCFAVGGTDAGIARRTLAERYL